jgi:hypothetical protein
MINRVFVVGIAIALELATLPLEVSAKGIGGRGLHHGLRHSPYNALVAGYGFGGESVGGMFLPPQVVFVSPPQPTLTCNHSREAVTVLSEEGGTREITITRC